MVNLVCWLIVLLIAIIGFALFCRQYANPYKLILIFGKKGCGKTTFITKNSWKLCNKGVQVYLDAPVSFEHENLHIFNPREFGQKAFPPDAVIFMDEVGITFDNRKFKQLPDCVRDYFKYQRHYKNTIYMFSQDFDVDIKIRKLTDYMYLMENKMNVFSVAKRIRRTIDIVQATGDSNSESRIVDNLEFVPAWMMLFGVQSRIFTYIPKWVNKFNSFDVAELEFFE